MKLARGGSTRRLGCVALALAIGGSCLGCDRGPAGPERYARRFLPYEPNWRLESEIPEEPQKTPGMVIWEFSHIAPFTPATPEQRSAAEDLIERSHAAVQARGWEDYEQGLADGFRLMPSDDRHFMSEEFLRDDVILDPERPEFLMYYKTPDGMALTGLMFYVRSFWDRGPQVGGPLTLWHYHVWNRPYCFYHSVVPGGFLENAGFLENTEGCAGGEVRYRSPEMIHVWLVDHPEGPFATRMYINPALLPKLLARRMQERGY